MGSTSRKSSYTKRWNTDLVVIPGGMTSILQLLDVSINKPLKEYVPQEYEKWIANPNLPLTKAGKTKKAPPSVIASWISIAWQKISEDIIRKSFKKCCISNALDGSEDDVLWAESSDTDSAQDDHEETESESSEEDEECDSDDGEE